MGDGGLPAETGPPVSEDLQQRGIDFLQGLLASGKADLDRFRKALDALLGAQTQADFASVVRGLPPPVDFTPPARRRHEPLEISASMGEVRLESRWQVSRLTKINRPVRWPVADANASSRHEDRESVATSRARSGRNKWLPSARIPALQKLGPEHRRSDLM
jgi:hypothetical protein